MSDRTYPEGTPFTGVIRRTVATSVPAWPEPRRAPAGSPNVLIVLFDDVGFAQFGCFGSDIATPTLDRLAAEGLRYRDFHTTALCTPSRASLLTGRNHHANTTARVAEQPLGFPGYHAMIPRENGFLSEILRAEGYATFALGKWHLTPYHESAVGSTHERWPTGRGFDRFYGFLGAKTHQYAPDLRYDGHAVAPPKTPEEGYHLNADMADRAIEFITDLRAATPDRPFFMYYCPGAGHEPHHVPRDWADRYAGRFDAGWDRLRAEAFGRQMGSGVLPPGTRLSPRPEWVPAWDSLTDDERRLFARQMEVYAGFITHTDHHLGRVVAFLDRLGELDNTLVIVTSDNGASAEGDRYGVDGYAPELMTLESNLRHLDERGGPTTLPNYSWGWAWAGNTPFKRWKRYVHEGGISDPLIVRWPARVRARGEVRHQYAHITDIVPTVLDAIAVQPPREIAGVPQSPLHGVSFAHTFDVPDAPTRKTVQYYEMFGSRAIWADGWKAVTAQGLQRSTTPMTDEELDAQRWELYRVAEDPSECDDLAERYPQKLRELTDLWWAEAGKYDVLPVDGWRRVERGLVERTRHVYYPGGAPLPASLAARILDRSHRITAQVEIPQGGAEGVILAHGGGPYGGYSLFVKEDRLHYVHRHPAYAEDCVSTAVTLPRGAVELGLAFARTAPLRGDVVLSIDGREVARGRIERMLPAMGGAHTEGLCCGYDGGLPVSSEYASPFTFTGTIERVVVELEPA